MQVDVGEFVKIRRIVYTLHVNWNGGWTVSENRKQNVSLISFHFPAENHVVCRSLFHVHLYPSQQQVTPS